MLTIKNYATRMEVKLKINAYNVNYFMTSYETTISIAKAVAISCNSTDLDIYALLEICKLKNSLRCKNVYKRLLVKCMFNMELYQFILFGKIGK